MGPARGLEGEYIGEQGRLLDRPFARSGEGERDLDLVEMGFVEEVEGGREEGRREEGGRKEGKGGGKGGEVLGG